MLAYLPSPVERPFKGLDKAGAEEARAADEKNADGGVRLEDDRRSVRRPHHDVPRRLRRAEGRFHRSQQDQGRARAARASGAAPGQDADDGARDQGGRSGIGREAEGHADQRHARRQGRPDHLSAHQVSRAGAVVRDRAEDPRRRRQDQHVDAPPRRRGSRRSATAAIRRPRSCCSRDRVSCTSKSRSPS